MSIIKMRGPIDVLFAFKIFSLPVPTRPGTRTFWQVPDPSRPEVKNLYLSDPVAEALFDDCKGRPGLIFFVRGSIHHEVSLSLNVALGHLKQEVTKCHGVHSLPAST